MVEIILFFASLAVIIIAGILLNKLRPIVVNERRMKGFYPMSIVALAWIAASAVYILSAPEYFAYTYITRVSFSIVVPYLTFWFVLHFIESPLVRSKATKIFLIAAPAIDLIALLTTPLHKLYFLNLDYPVYPETKLPMGFLFWFHVALIAASVLFFFILLYRYIIKNFRRYPLLIVAGVGILIPFLLNIAFTVEVFGLKYDLSPIGYFVTIMLYMYFTYATYVRNFNATYFRDTMAAITRSPILYAGNFEDAAIMIAEEGCRALNVQCIAVWEFSNDMKQLKRTVSYDTLTKKVASQTIINIANSPKYKERIMAEQFFVVNDIAIPNDLSGSTRDYNPSLCAFIDAPIRIGGEFYGIIRVEQHRCMAYPERREWTSIEQNLTTSLAGFLTVALENVEHKRLEAAVDDANKLLTAVNQAAALLLTTKDDEDAEKNILSCMELVGRANKVDRVHIWKYEYIDGRLHYVCFNTWSKLGDNDTLFKGYKRAFDEGPKWNEHLADGTIISGPISMLPAEDYEFVKSF